jgi:hypothetical protein
MMQWRTVRGDGDLNQVYNLVMKELPSLAEVPINPRICSKRLLQVFREAAFFEVLEDATKVYGVLVFNPCNFFDYSTVSVASMSYLLVNNSVPLKQRVLMISDALDKAEKQLKRKGYNVLVSDSSRANQAVFRKLLLKLGYKKPRLTPEAYLLKWI